MQTNLYESYNFKLEVARNKFLDAVATEYLQMLSILYGAHIYSGEKRTSDYSNMTMLEVADELRIRTLMMQGDRLRKKRQMQEEHARNEADLLERLRKSSM